MIYAVLSLIPFGDGASGFFFASLLISWTVIPQKPHRLLLPTQSFEA